MELIDLIQYENEKTGLDFKAVIYKADKFDDLLKDIMAMANAALEEDRYIVVGVKHHPSSERVDPGSGNQSPAPLLAQRGVPAGPAPSRRCHAASQQGRPAVWGSERRGADDGATCVRTNG